MRWFLLLAFVSCICHAKSEQSLITFSGLDKDSTTKEITIYFVVPHKDFIYKDFITCSVSEPSVTLSPWHANKQSISYYDPYFNDSKHVFNEDFSISMMATAITSKNDYCSNPIHLYCSYYRKADNKPNDIFFTFSFSKPVETHIQVDDADIILTTEIGSNSSPHHHIYHHPLDGYYAGGMEIIDDISTFFATNHKKCFYVLIILTALFLFLFTIYREQLYTHKKWYELIEMILFLFTITDIAYVLGCIYMIHNPIGTLLATNLSVLFLAFTAFYALKKSTKISRESLRTVYTCIGMISMSGMLIALFKTVQYAEKYL